PPLERGGLYSPSREPALSLVTRLRPRHPRTTRPDSAGASLDLLDPLGFAAPLTWQVRFQCREQPRDNPGALIGSKLQGFSEQRSAGLAMAAFYSPATISTRRTRDSESAGPTAHAERLPD